MGKDLMKQMSCAILLLALTPGIKAYNFNPNDPEHDTIKKVKDLDLTTINFTDDPFIQQLDSLMFLSFFEEGIGLNGAEYTAELDTLSAPVFADSIYLQRIAELNSQTPFELTYNDAVKNYIDVYAQRRREQVSRMLGLAEYYFPMFEEHLDKYNLPLELKYLAIVESALNPLARSRAGATGLWQFMFATARMNGLNISSYIDERCDPLKSTQAACKYLSKLHGIFGDWNLALAAYNSGPGNVGKAIRRSGGKRDYWEISPYLPRETRGYVPAFIAVNYIMNYADEHNIYPSSIKPSYYQTDTVMIKEKLSFEQIAALVDIPEEELQFLNPAYRYKIIPDDEEGQVLVLPNTHVGLFVSYEDSIYKLAHRDFKKSEETLPAQVEMDEKLYHRVRRGEVLGLIAEKYGVSVSSLKNWNGLRGNTIRVGQRLAVYPRKIPASTSSVADASQSKDSSGKYENYNVKYGESFYSIARKYPGISADDIMEWNNIKNARSLRPGMSLKIYIRS